MLSFQLAAFYTLRYGHVWTQKETAFIRFSTVSSWSYGIEYFWLIDQVWSKAQRREHSELCDQSCNAARLHGCRS